MTAQRIVPSFVDDARGADADAEDRLVRAGEDLVDQVVDERRRPRRRPRRRGRVLIALADLAAQVERGPR